MTGFTKLFAGLVHSTVWREEMHVKVVWITMLALADRNGQVAVSLPGLADASRVTLPQCEDALRILTSPDTYSRTKLYEGRRIQEIDGGWQLLNYLKYRELRNADERRISVREAVRKHRQNKKAQEITVNKVIPSNHIAEAEAEAYAEANKGGGMPPPPKDLSGIPRYDEIRGRIPEMARASLDGLIRAARSPVALVGELGGILDGMHGPATPEAVGMALRDLVLGGGRVTGKGLRAFVRSAMQGTPATQTDKWDALIAKAEEEERATRKV